MTVTQSTFGATQEKFNSLPATPETPPVAAPPTPTEPTPPPVSPTDTPPVQPTDTPAATPADDTQKDTVEFDMSFEEEAPAVPSNTPSSPPAPGLNWKEELIKNRDAVIAELGLSPFALEMDKHIKGGGKPIDYLMAKAIDYNQVSDEKLLKDKMREEYPNLTDTQIELMYKRRYEPAVDATEDDIAFLEAQTKGDAYKLRQHKIAEQNRFQVADAMPLQTDEGYEAYKKTVADSKKQYEDNVNFYNNHAATKALNESKRVTINLGDGVPAFNFALSKPELITQALTDDGSVMHKLMTTKTGEPDVAKEQLVTLFAFNPSGFIQEIFNYGMQQGVLKKLVGDNQNAQRPSATVLPMSPDAKPVYRQSTFGQTSGR